MIAVVGSMIETIQTLVVVFLHSFFDKVDTILDIIIEAISTTIVVHIYMAIMINFLFILLPGLVSILCLWQKGQEQ